MTTNINDKPTGLLQRLRSVVPQRPLSVAEARRVAELQANVLLKLCGIGDAGTPAEIVEALPFVEVSYRHDLPTSGLTYWRKPRWQIVINADEPFVRQRFSLMHELKHALDHPFIDYLYPAAGTTDSDKRAELTADYFAACALMPRRHVKRLWGEGVQQVGDLAGVFGVSELAMSYRLDQLGLTEPRRRCDHGYRRLPALPGYFRAAWTPEALLGAAA